MEAGKYRIGAVSYLNARPLIYGLESHAAVDLVIDLPSRLASGLAEGRFDVAMIPSIEHFRQPGSSVVSDACIATYAEVKSVKLYGRCPVEQIKTISLDEGSRTSAALARVILAENYGVFPAVETLPIVASPAESNADALLLIGDRGMLPPEEQFAFVWDLGEQWQRWTGLPFVFALWIARPGLQTNGVAPILSQARDEGVRHFEQIARQTAPTIGVPEEQCLAYLRDHLRFHFGPAEQCGLQRFFELAAKHGLAPAEGKLVFDRPLA